MTVVLVVVILSLCGMAIDLGRMYNRKVELQNLADVIALAAAKELDGSAAGVNRARAAAGRAAMNMFYNYNNASVEWSEDALSFGAAPGGSTWFDAGSAAQPTRALTMFFARVDTRKLAVQHGDVPMVFMAMLPSIGPSSHLASVATAGRVSIDVTPLAICAMSASAGEARGTELVQYGFRRGISYNLMKLNPNGTSKGANYLVNPVAVPGTAGVPVMDRLDVVRPFACTGTLAVPSLAGGNITVEPDFPLGGLYQQLNSRFGQYTAPCDASTAPPDTNVKRFDFSTEFPWMAKPPTGQSAETRTSGNKLLTIADLPSNVIPGSTTGGMYGPLWIYAKAVVKDSKYVEGAPEPASGYTKFSTSNWPALYTPGAQQVKAGQTYPSTPYLEKVEAPVGLAGVANRRVLNVPLLRCPVAPGSPTTAEVLGIARFFMTVPATETDLHAEFAGLAPQDSLAGQVRLFK
ncbi:hypothetical protein B0920_17340 [Massilia sp. KIM]|nr:hypothetical protein B0920_17340 [Massilia sp. KIM]